MVTRSGPGAALTAPDLTPGVTQMRPKATTPSLIVRTCETCGEAFSTPARGVRSQQRFCSRPCSHVRKPNDAPIVSSDGLSAQLPLCARDGSVRAYVTVDAVDAAWANQWRWHLNDNGYAARNEWAGGGRYITYALHRELLGLVAGDGLDGDHIDRDRLNCRRSNLRAIADGKNSQNVSARGGASEYRGVTWSKLHKKWRVVVRLNRKTHHIGLFDDENVAAKVARQARARLMPYAVD